MIEILKKVFIFLDAIFQDEELDKLIKEAKGTKEWGLKIGAFALAKLFSWLTAKAVTSEAK